jgi:hypothetical protein
MTDKIDLGKVYRPSEDVVVREIEGEVVIVPLTSGIGDLEDELFTLNETGRAIWSRIDGRWPRSSRIWAPSTKPRRALSEKTSWGSCRSSSTEG